MEIPHPGPASLASWWTFARRACSAVQPAVASASASCARAVPAAAWLADLLGGLEVDTARMRSNLAQLEAAGVAEAADLTASVAAAAALVERALGGEPS